VGASSASVSASWNPEGVPTNGDTVTFSTGSYQDCTWDISPYLVNFNYLGGSGATRSSVITLTNNLFVNGTLTVQSAHASYTCTLAGNTYQVTSYENTIVSTRGIFTQGTGISRLGNCSLTGGTITQAGPIYFYSLIMSSGTLTGSATQNVYIIDGYYQKTGGTVGTNLRLFFISTKYISYYNNATTYSNQTTYTNQTDYNNQTDYINQTDYYNSYTNTTNYINQTEGNQTVGSFENMEMIIYMIFLIFLTIINIIGFLRIPLLSGIIAICVLLIALASISVFEELYMLPFIMLLLNVLISIFAVTRAR
jgi:hypothetical protein